MATVTIRCPRCGLALQAEATPDPVVCAGCGKEFLLPRGMVKEATGATDEGMRQAMEAARMQEAFSLLETKLDSPLYDHNIQEALGIFSSMIRDDKTNSLAWSGLFGGLLHQCRKTFRKMEKIPGTDYWFSPGTQVFQNFFQVEGYFYKVTVDESGKMRPVLCDSVIQPGRKAHYYLNSAIANAAEGEEKENLQKLMEQFFTKAPAEMAEKGLDHLMQLRAEAREKADQRILGKG